MANIYTEADEWGNVAMVKMAMRERGVKKVPAYGWVEIDHKVHVFTANNRTLTEEIRRKINYVGKRMEDEAISLTPLVPFKMWMRIS